MRRRVEAEAGCAAAAAAADSIHGSLAIASRVRPHFVGLRPECPKWRLARWGPRAAGLSERSIYSSASPVARTPSNGNTSQPASGARSSLAARPPKLATNGNQNAIHSGPVGCSLPSRPSGSSRKWPGESIGKQVISLHASGGRARSEMIATRPSHSQAEMFARAILLEGSAGKSLERERARWL